VNNIDLEIGIALKKELKKCVSPSAGSTTKYKYKKSSKDKIMGLPI